MSCACCSREEAADLPDAWEVEWAPVAPYWSILWRSGVALARELDGVALSGLRIVELGCGLGVPSIAAARGGATVLATDTCAEALDASRAKRARERGADRDGEGRVGEARRARRAGAVRPRARRRRPLRARQRRARCCRCCRSSRPRPGSPIPAARRPGPSSSRLAAAGRSRRACAASSGSTGYGRPLSTASRH